jgi:hypothetical protein
MRRPEELRRPRDERSRESFSAEGWMKRPRKRCQAVGERGEEDIIVGDLQECPGGKMVGEGYNESLVD